MSRRRSRRYTEREEDSDEERTVWSDQTEASSKDSKQSKTAPPRKRVEVDSEVHEKTEKGEPLPIKSLHTDVDRVSEYVGMPITGGDGQYKAATVRFLASSTSHWNLKAKPLEVSLGPGIVEVPNRTGEATKKPNGEPVFAGSVDDWEQAELLLPHIVPPEQNSLNPRFSLLPGMLEFENSVAFYVNLDDDSLYDNIVLFTPRSNAVITPSILASAQQDIRDRVDRIETLCTKVEDFHDGHHNQQSSDTLEEIKPSIVTTATTPSRPEETPLWPDVWITFDAPARMDENTLVVRRILKTMQRHDTGASSTSTTRGNEPSASASVEVESKNVSSPDNAEESSEDEVRPLDSMVLFARFTKQPFVYWGTLTLMNVTHGRCVRFLFRVNEPDRLWNSLSTGSQLLRLASLGLGAQSSSEESDRSGRSSSTSKK